LGEWLREVIKITDPQVRVSDFREVGGKDDSGRDNGSSIALEGHSAFQLCAMRSIIQLIPTPSPNVAQTLDFVAQRDAW
jgi:hypothetical protein